MFLIENKKKIQKQLVYGTKSSETVGKLQREICYVFQTEQEELQCNRVIMLITCDSTAEYSNVFKHYIVPRREVGVTFCRNNFARIIYVKVNLSIGVKLLLCKGRYTLPVRTGRKDGPYVRPYVRACFLCTNTRTYTRSVYQHPYVHTTRTYGKKHCMQCFFARTARTYGWCVRDARLCRPYA